MALPRFKDEDRQFGVTVGTVFAAIGLFLLFRRNFGSVGGTVSLVLGLGLVLFGLLAPRLLKPVHKGWMAFAAVLGWINTRLILGAVFYTMFFLSRVGLFLFRKDPMHRRPDKRMDTYWNKIADPEPEPASYENSF